MLRHTPHASWLLPSSKSTHANAITQASATTGITGFETLRFDYFAAQRAVFILHISGLLRDIYTRRSYTGVAYFLLLRH